MGKGNMSSPRKQDRHTTPDFSGRLQALIEEFGSRYALSKASGIPVSTLQAYEAGSKPGLDALVALARTANVSLDWLLTGTGEKRSTGQPPGATLADLIMVDQFQPGTALQIPTIIGQIPFSRHLLEEKLHLQQPSHKTLLAVQATLNVHDIRRGDLVLIDRQQNDSLEDGVYLLNLPGLVLREISVLPDQWYLVSGAEASLKARKSLNMPQGSLKLQRDELLGDGRFAASKVVGRAVLLQRTI
jgi:hypothetical protein